jgi:hypothetical protein
VRLCFRPPTMQPNMTQFQMAAVCSIGDWLMQQTEQQTRMLGLGQTDRVAGCMPLVCLSCHHHSNAKSEGWLSSVTHDSFDWLHVGCAQASQTPAKVHQLLNMCACATAQVCAGP